MLFNLLYIHKERIETTVYKGLKNTENENNSRF